MNPVRPDSKAAGFDSALRGADPSDIRAGFDRAENEALAGLGRGTVGRLGRMDLAPIKRAVSRRAADPACGSAPLSVIVDRRQPAPAIVSPTTNAAYGVNDLTPEGDG